jgi:hypothetical protein
MSRKRSTTRQGYGSFAPRRGAALYLTRADLRRVADLLDQREGADVGLATPPPEMVQTAPIELVRIVPRDDGFVVIRSEGTDVLEITGGPEARSLLAATLRNLAMHDEKEFTERHGGHAHARIHVDVDYFPDHPFLAESSMWVTILLADDPE